MLAFVWLIVMGYNASVGMATSACMSGHDGIDGCGVSCMRVMLVPSFYGAGYGLACIALLRCLCLAWLCGFALLCCLY